MEDYLELQDPALKKQIEKSHQQYRRGKARDAGKFLKEICRLTAKPRKRMGG